MDISKFDKCLCLKGEDLFLKGEDLFTLSLISYLTVNMVNKVCHHQKGGICWIHPL